MKNDLPADDNPDIIGFPIIYNYQFIGYLFPNSILDETFIVQETQHAGLHMTYGFFRKGMPEH